MTRHSVLWKALIGGLLVALTALAGCGYRLQETGTPASFEFASLAIPMFSTTASYRGFEGAFTEVVRQEFISHARVPLVGRERADAVLLGRVHDIRTDPLTYSLDQATVAGRTVTHEVTRSRWLKIKLDASLVDNRSGRVLWADPDMADQASYQVSADPLEERYNREQALREMAQRLAERIYLQVMGRF